MKNDLFSAIRKIHIKIYLIGILFSIITISGCATPPANKKEKQPLSYNDTYTNNDTNINTQILLIPFYENAVESRLKSGSLDIKLSEKRALFHSGLTYYKNGDWEQAISSFKKALTEYLYLKDYSSFYIASSYENKGEFDKAISSFSDIVTNWPESPLWPQANLKIADIYFCLDKYKEAIETYEKCLEFLPKEEEYIRYQTGICNLNIDPNLTIKHFKTLLINYPKSDWSNLAQMNLTNLELNKPHLFQNYHSIIEEDIPYPVYLILSEEERLQRAKKLFKKKDYRSAITAYMSLLNEELNPQSRCTAMYNLTKCYKNTGKTDLAIEKLKDIIDTMPQGECVSDSRLFLARILWNQDRDEEALEHYKFLLENSPSPSIRQEVLYLLGRMAEEDGRYSDAINYYIEIIEGNIKDSYYSMTIWRIGWIYYINSYYEYAIEYFESYWRTINNYALRHQFLYWKARAEEKMGWRDKAYMTYQSILNEDDWSFYSWLAKEKLGYQDDYSHPYFSDLQEEIMLQDPFSMLSEQEHSILNRIIELLILGLKEELVKEISCHAYSGKRERPQFLYSLAILAHTAGEYELGIRIGILYKNRIKDLSQDILFKNAGNALIYPLAFLDKILENSKKYQLDPVLILSIIRQESLFDPYSLSYASAYGLMQVIPSTGRSSAKELGIEFPADTASLFDTDLNLTLGCFYFKKVLNEYGNNVFHALAAYNAGPGALTKWQNRFGEMDIDEFIERIPYPETREYVKRVMKNYSVYSRLSAFSKKYSK